MSEADHELGVCLVIGAGDAKHADWLGQGERDSTQGRTMHSPFEFIGPGGIAEEAR